MKVYVGPLYRCADGVADKMSLREGTMVAVLTAATSGQLMVAAKELDLPAVRALDGTRTLFRYLITADERVRAITQLGATELTAADMGQLAGWRADRILESR